MINSYSYNRSAAAAGSRLAGAVFLSAALILGNTASYAGPLEQAERIHDRLAGVPASPDVLAAMESDIAGGDARAAAFKAIADPHFYTVTLKNFAAPWTNRDQSAFVPLNDYTTLVIGMVRDNVPFDQILSADLLYVGTGISPPPSVASNAHYEALEQAMLDPDFDPTTGLQPTTQSAVYGLPPAATAGAITTRAAAQAFFVAGTNRAMFRFTLIDHLCTDLEQVHDVTIVPDRIRQDVSRSPGGDSRVFLNSCIGCHAGMDPMAQAFAYYNYVGDNDTGRIEYTPGAVQEKYFHNATTFPDGFVTPDDSWSNYWRAGQNAKLGWDGDLPGSGSGAKSLGQELAGSQAFAQCQAKKVFRAVCLREPGNQADRNEVATMASTLKNGGFKLKNSFADAAVYCMGN
jgi:hypothetical protein